MNRVVLATILCITIEYAYGASASRDGLIWYYDPRTLTAEQREVIEIARHYLDKSAPNERLHHKYGGLIDISGDSWEVSFAPSSTDRENSAPHDLDVIVFIDRKSKRVTHTLLGQ